MNATSPKISKLVHDRLMARTGEERFLMGVRMHEAARRIVMASLPEDASGKEKKQLVFERFYASKSATA